MTVEASPLSVVERLALLDDLRGFRQRARQCARAANLSAGTTDCIICRSAATTGAAGKR
jgi:hypothetical protein